MIHKDIVYCGRPQVLACDARCGKAWGVNSRPQVDLSDGADPDDFAYLTDGELGDAPMDPGTYEGGHAKPRSEGGRLNRWCARQCERSVIEDSLAMVVLPDYGRPRFNMRHRQDEADAKALSTAS